MRMSKKNKKAFDMGVSDRREGILFERNPFQYMSLSPNSGWWQKGWKSEDEVIRKVGVKEYRKETIKKMKNLEFRK